MSRLLALLPFCAALAAGCDGSAEPAPAAESAARAYLQQLVQAQPRPSAEEVHKFYAQHPELFAQRRLFTLEQIEVTREASLATALRERAARGASMDEIADSLRLREIQHAFTRGVRAAEQIPLDLLPRLQAMREGEVQAIDPGGDALFVIRVVATRLAPLDEAAAAPLIEQFLLKRSWSEVIGTEMQQLRRAARIEYVEERK